MGIEEPALSLGTPALPTKAAVDDVAAVRLVAPPFEDFYLANRDEVGRCLALTLGDVGLGFEAADEAMVRAFERWDAIGGGPNPAGWVYRTGLNWARTWHRRRRRAVDRAQLVARPVAHIEDAADPDLAAALSALDDNHRAVVVLRYLCDWSVVRTADALQISPGTVKSRLSRALDHLNRTLVPFEGDAGR